MQNSKKSCRGIIIPIELDRKSKPHFDHRRICCTSVPPCQRNFRRLISSAHNFFPPCKAGSLSSISSHALYTVSENNESEKKLWRLTSSRRKILNLHDISQWSLIAYLDSTTHMNTIKAPFLLQNSLANYNYVFNCWPSLSRHATFPMMPHENVDFWGVLVSPYLHLARQMEKT